MRTRSNRCLSISHVLLIFSVEGQMIRRWSSSVDRMLVLSSAIIMAAKERETISN